MHKHTGRHTNTNANTSAHTFAVHGQCISKIDVGFTCGWADNDVVKCYDGHQCAYPRRLASTVMNQHVQMLKTNFIDNTNLYREAPDSSLVHQHRNDVPPSPGCHMFKFIYCKYHDRKIDRQTDQRMDTLDRSSHRDLRRHLISLLWNLCGQKYRQSERRGLWGLRVDAWIIEYKFSEVLQDMVCYVAAAQNQSKERDKNRWTDRQTILQTDRHHSDPKRKCPQIVVVQSHVDSRCSRFPEPPVCKRRLGMRIGET